MKKKRIFIVLCAVLVLASIASVLLLRKPNAAPDTSLFGRGYSWGRYAFGIAYGHGIVNYTPEYYISDNGILHFVENPDRKEGEEYTFKETSYPLIPFTLTKENFDDLLSEAKGRWLIGRESEYMRSLVRSAWYFETDGPIGANISEPIPWVYYVLQLENGDLLYGSGAGKVTITGKHKHTLTGFSTLDDLGPWEDVQNGIVKKY